MKTLREYIGCRNVSINEANVPVPSDAISYYHDLVNCTKRMKSCRNLNDVSKEKETAEKALAAYEALSSRGFRYATLSTMWVDFVDAAWHPVWMSLEDPIRIDKKIAAFNNVAKWLVPILAVK